MDIREVTGYVAHVLIAACWLWMLRCTAPQLRKGARCRKRRLQITAIRSAALLLTTAVVCVIHLWTTAWWQVAVALLVAGGLGVLLRRSYRRLVAAPRHRGTLTRRSRTVQINQWDQHRPAAHGHRPIAGPGRPSESPAVRRPLVEPARRLVRPRR